MLLRRCMDCQLVNNNIYYYFYVIRSSRYWVNTRFYSFDGARGVVGSILACYSLDIFEILYWNCTVHVPTVFVVVPTSCQWLGREGGGVGYSPPWHTHPWTYPPQKGPGTKDTHPPSGQNDWQTKLTYLTCLSILCFNLGEIVSCVWYTSFF